MRLGPAVAYRVTHRPGADPRRPGAGRREPLQIGVYRCGSAQVTALRSMRSQVRPDASLRGSKSTALVREGTEDGRRPPGGQSCRAHCWQVEPAPSVTVRALLWLLGVGQAPVTGAGNGLLPDATRISGRPPAELEQRLEVAVAYFGAATPSCVPSAPSGLQRYVDYLAERMKRRCAEGSRAPLLVGCGVGSARVLRGEGLRADGAERHRGGERGDEDRCGARGAGSRGVILDVGTSSRAPGCGVDVAPSR